MEKKKIYCIKLMINEKHKGVVGGHEDRKIPLPWIKIRSKQSQNF